MQHRRGIKTDLPDNLYEGELGWCLDTRELFIGNGRGFSGNSQVLTQWSQNTDLINYTYVGQSTIPATTGVSAPVSRSLQAKLDDFANVKDYGAKGDGVTDDTIAIQRAIVDRWQTMPLSNNLQPTSMANIWFPPGIYKISESIKVYPLIGLIGSGPAKTILKMDESVDTCLLRTVDGNGNISANIGLDGAVLPNNILLQGMTFDNSTNPLASGVLLQRSNRIWMINCEVVGGWNLSDSTAIPANGVTIETLGNLYLCDDITLQSVSINNFVNGLFSNDPTRYVNCENINFVECNRGAVFGETAVLGGPSYVRITNSTFRDIQNRGLAVFSPNPGITSTNNVYTNVGDISGVRPIFFSTISNACSSVNDVFSRQTATKIDIGNAQKNMFISPQQVSIPSNTPITFGPITLLDNVSATPTSITYNLALYNTIFLQYSIVRGSTKRIGTLMLIADGSSVTVYDTGTDHNGSTGVDLTATVANGTLTVLYSTTNLGRTASLSYIETKWFT